MSEVYASADPVWKLFQFLGISFFIAAVALLIFFFWAKGGMLTAGISNTNRYDLCHSPPFLEKPLTVVTWNIAWGQSEGSSGTNYVPKPRDRLQSNVDQMGDWLISVEPDVIFLQEVDFDSARSHGVNQALAIAKRAGLCHVVTGISWRANYIPFPYFPLSSQFGRMQSGGAILSRYPISGARLELFPKPQGNPWWYNAFYLSRYALSAQIQWGQTVITVMNVHLDAFDPKNRIEQAKIVVSHLAKSTPPLVLGGDFNESITNGPSVKNEESVYNIVSSLLSPVPSLGQVSKAPSFSPSERIDGIFTSSNFSVLNYEIGKTGSISDHLPFVAKIGLTK